MYSVTAWQHLGLSHSERVEADGTHFFFLLHPARERRERESVEERERESGEERESERECVCEF